MSELMTEEAFADMVDSFANAVIDYEVAPHEGEAEAASYSRRGVLKARLIHAYSAAVATAPDPRVGPLAEALERINTLALSAYDLDTKTQGDDLRGIINQIGRWVEAALAAKGEAAEEPWTRSEAAVPKNRQLCDVLNWDKPMYFTVHADGPLYWSNRPDGPVIAWYRGTEWRPVREASDGQ